MAHKIWKNIFEDAENIVKWTFSSNSIRADNRVQC